jgi:DNA polymerase-3 subunit gamma/tau
LDNVEQALADFRHGVSSGRVAHAYLLLGDPRGAAGELATRMLELLFCRADAPPCGGSCESCRQVRERRHADILWLEPESKSRQIRIEDIREKLIPRI